jgi:hypothetical protein
MVAIRATNDVDELFGVIQLVAVGCNWGCFWLRGTFQILRKITRIAAKNHLELILVFVLVSINTKNLVSLDSSSNSKNPAEVAK